MSFDLILQALVINGMLVHLNLNIELLYSRQISDEGLKRRELLVLDTCLGAGIPVAGWW